MKNWIKIVLIAFFVSGVSFGYCDVYSNDYKSDKNILEKNISSLIKKDQVELLIAFSKKHGCRNEAQDVLRSHMKRLNEQDRTTMLIELVSNTDRTKKLNETIEMFLEDLSEPNQFLVLKQMLKS